ncbi:MAG TPA: ABC transporter substrate-binding protein [Methylomirabilota bacterium]
MVALVAPITAGAQPALPPVKAITDVKSVAGQWDGLAFSTTGPSGPFQWTIREDGSYEMSPMGVTGTLRVSDGKLLFRGALTGRTGSLTLHEGGGQRLLKGASDDGVFTFELRPAAARARPSTPIASTTSQGVRRVGVLAMATRAGEAGGMQPLWQRLSELGWVPGQNLVIEYRSAEGKLDRLPVLAAELVNLKVDVVIATCGPQVVAVQQASSAMPIVSVCPDFVVAGMATNLARPGRNITGVAMLGRELIGKRLEVLKAAVPKASRVAFLWRTVYERTFFVQEMDGAGQRLGLKVLPAFEVQGPDDFAGAFAAMARDRADAVVVPADPVTLLHQKPIIELAARHRLPAIFDLREFVDAGGLVSYGPTSSEILGRVASLTDRILKGAKPGELPVEQPTKFELVVNLKTARALGLTIPPALLLRADHVIE